MYAINPTSKFVLISPDECTAKVSNSALDSKKWQMAIELAEARFVIPLLGYKLYKDICNQKNVIVTNGNIVALQTLFTAQFGTNINTNPNVVLKVGQIVNAVELITATPSYISLWNEALWNYVFNCVYFIAMTENYAQFSSDGLLKNNPIDSAIGTESAKSVGISLADLRYLNDRWLLDRVNPLQDVCEQYLCANITLYPLYPIQKCEKWGCFNNSSSNNDGELTKRTTTFINIYEDEDNCNVRRRRGRDCEDRC